MNYFNSKPDFFFGLYQQIYREFFSASEDQPCSGTVFEAYSSAGVSNPGYTCEIRVAAEKEYFCNIL